jgi:hypothetical protein
MSELDRDVATPTNDTAWNADGELTFLFSSNFPSMLNSVISGAVKNSWSQYRG